MGSSTRVYLTLPHGEVPPFRQCVAAGRPVFVMNIAVFLHPRVTNPRGLDGTLIVMRWVEIPPPLGGQPLY